MNVNPACHIETHEGPALKIFEDLPELPHRIQWGVAPTWLGSVSVVAVNHILVSLALDELTGSDIPGRLPGFLKNPMKGRAMERADTESVSFAENMIGRIFDPLNSGTAASPLKILLWGTPYQKVIWRRLLQVPSGSVISYKEIANEINSSPRAVGGAIGANRLAYLIPCHRVVGANGTLTGFRWGLEKKRSLLNYEGARI